MARTADGRYTIHGAIGGVPVSTPEPISLGAALNHMATFGVDPGVLDDAVPELDPALRFVGGGAS